MEANAKAAVRSTGRLEDHLRAAPKCVRKLRRLRPPAEEIRPGYGSRGRRQMEAEHYTPAPPRPAPGTEENAADDAWSSWQRRLHEELSELLLQRPLPEDLPGLMRRKLAKFPLYQEEIQAVLQHLSDEVDLIHSDADLGQWTAAQHTAIQEAIRLHQSEEPQQGPSDQRDLRLLGTLDAFKKSARTFDWRAAIRRHGIDNGTRSTTLYKLPACWEGRVATEEE